VTQGSSVHGKEKIQKLIEVARYAPTGSNTQMVEWLVFSDPAKIKEFAEMTVEWMRAEFQKNPQSPRAFYMPMIVAAWDVGYDAGIPARQIFSPARAQAAQDHFPVARPRPKVKGLE